MEKQEYIDAIKAKIAQLNELVAAAEKATGEEEMVKVAEKSEKSAPTSSPTAMASSSCK